MARANVARLKPTEGLLQSYSAFAAWMHEAALPYWIGAGQDKPGLGFTEHLTLEGTPAQVPFKRVRVQARQIYVFSEAALNGFSGALEAAENGYAFLTKHGWSPSGGFVRRLGASGGVVDPVVDLYENAFVMFAMAWFARARGDDEPIQWAHRTLDVIEKSMPTPGGEGFENAIPIQGGPRQQNPHMHLLEALLALYQTTKEARFAFSARKLLQHFRRRLFDAQSGTLAEVFDGNWSRLGSRDGQKIEPGHHFEWVWLLDEAERQLGEPTGSELRSLYDFAVRYGTNPATGWVVDAVDTRGQPLELSGRVWPQTEAIKAHLVMWRRGEAKSELEASRLNDLLLNQFLCKQPRGTWVEHLSPDRTHISDKIPATSFYHIAMAFSELKRTVLQALAAPSLGQAHI